MQAIKCMIIGDPKVGKTDLFLTFTTGSPAKTYVPTVFDTYAKELDNATYSVLGLWDSAGDSLYDAIRPISYPHTDCFIVCFSLDDMNSYENIEKKWKPEILRYGDGPDVPIILVGTKSDLKDSRKVSFKDGEELKSRIGALDFFECSSKDQESIEKVMTKAIQAAIIKKIEDEKPQNPVWGFEDLKILIVGDTTVGKSSIANGFTSRRSIVDAYQPTTEVEPHYQDMVLDGIEYFMGIFDMPSTPEFIHDRIKEYQRASGIIICYAVNDPFSFQNIEQQWLPEIKEYCKDVPFMIVGNKIDLKKDSDILIPSVDGEELMLSIGASAFVECSAKTLENLQEVFIAAAQAFRKSKSKPCDNDNSFESS